MPAFDATDEVYPYRKSHPGEARVAYLSSYPPRECGLATYCQDLLTATLTVASVGEPLVVAMENRGAHYDYPWPVVGAIDDHEESEYGAAAQFLNEAPIDLVSIQHEFGIFGGPRCQGLHRFLEELTKPVITTFHTVLPEPEPAQRAMIRELAGRSERVVVMNGLADTILQQQYQVDRRKIALIHHGAPAPLQENRDRAKARLGLAGRRVLSTFGLVSRGKGLEYAIRALPAIKQCHPDACYAIAGATHPGVQRFENESYREELMHLAKASRLGDAVIFINRYLSKQEILSFLAATDVYLTPYLNPNQITSGTLAYAVAAGRAVVSTGYLYARFLLRDNRGLLVDFADEQAIAEAVIRLLQDSKLQQELEGRCRVYGRRMLWPAVGFRCASIFREMLREQRAAALEPTYAARESEANGAGLFISDDREYLRQGGNLP